MLQCAYLPLEGTVINSTVSATIFQFLAPILHILFFLFSREKLMWTRKSRTLRQSNMIHDLYETFFIKEVTDSNFAICKVILPDSLDRE